MEDIINQIDNYLIGDLEQMLGAQGERGGLGYPIMATIASSMELLGRLLGGKKGLSAFEEFWKQFASDNPQYDDSELRNIFRKAVRDGTNHYYLIKFGIQISKQDKGNLTQAVNGDLNIDVVTLYKGFKTTYDRLKLEFLKKPELFISGYNSLISDLDRVKDEIRIYTKKLQPFVLISPNPYNSAVSASIETTLLGTYTKNSQDDLQR